MESKGLSLSNDHSSIFRRALAMPPTMSQLIPVGAQPEPSPGYAALLTAGEIAFEAPVVATVTPTPPVLLHPRHQTGVAACESLATVAITAVL